MDGALTKKVTDLSDRQSFCFGFLCERCGNVWQSERTPFTENTEMQDEKARRRIWEKDHRIAYLQANDEARYHFNHCPDCGRWVCQDCFRMGYILDYCADCCGNHPYECSNNENDEK
jgi:hypothetical protein